MTYKILITGAAGFAGYHLSHKLASQGHRLTVIDNFNRGRMDSDFEKLSQLSNVQLISADVTDARLYMELDKDFDYIYNLAAVIGVRNVTNNPDKVLYVNAISMLYLFEFAKNIPNLKKLFFSSTSEIYAGTMKHFGIDVPTNEEVPLTLLDVKSPRTTYMLSKMYGESICYNYGTKYNIPFTIGRYHNVYGPRMGFMHVIPEMFVKILKNNEIEVASPDHTRAFCYIDDAVEMTIKVTESEKTNQEILNIGNSREEISIENLVRKIAGVLQKDIAIKRLPETPGSPARRCPDTSKIEKLTAFRAAVDLEKGIELTYNWYKTQLHDVYE